MLLACSFRPPGPEPLDLAAVAPQDLRVSRCGATSVEAPPIGRLPGPISVPLTLHATTGLALVDVEIAGRTVPFLVDTAAGAHVLSDTLAAELGIETAPTRAVGTASTDVVGRMAEVDLTLGGQTFTSQPLVVLEREHLVSRLLGVKVFEIQGILGWPVLASGRLTLDFPGGKLRLEPSEGEGGGDLVWRGAPVVAGQIAGTPVQLLVDSGATISMLHHTAAEASGLEQTGGGQIAGGLGGGRIPVRTVRDVPVQALGQAVRFARLDVTQERTGPPEACDDGSLGMDFFRDHVLVLDAAAGSATVH